MNTSALPVAPFRAPLKAPFTAVLADDERLMRDQLRARLAEVWPELQIVAEAKNGLEAVQLVDLHRPDIVFLDIRMPGLTGVDAARQIAQLPPRQRATDAGDAAGAPAVGDSAAGPGAADAAADADDDLLPEIVFITAYDQYAVEAFEQGVADYVLKPAERERLQVTVNRIQQRLAARHDGPDTAAAAGAPAASNLQQLLHQLSARLNPGGAPSYLQWIQATVGQTIQMIPVDEVLFFISDEKYTRVQTAQVEALIRKPIKELVDEIDPRAFWQIHRSTLVNVKHIAGVTRDFRGRQIVGVKGHPEKLEVSRSYAQLFKGM
jgi:DNA-binding LytR/AlgR family response regulator